MKKITLNAELDMRALSEKAGRFYNGTDWQVWKDTEGGYYYGFKNGEHWGAYTFAELEEIFEEYADEVEGEEEVPGFDLAVSLMDDEIREAVHADKAPCTAREFLEEYKARHLEKYGEDFTF